MREDRGERRSRDNKHIEKMQKGREKEWGRRVDLSTKPEKRKNLCDLEGKGPRKKNHHQKKKNWICRPEPEKARL